MKYWHEIPQKEITKLVEQKKSVQFIIDNYKQPDWCNYPDALSGLMGCWSLNDNTTNGLRTNISRQFCKNCPEYIPE